MVSEIGEGLSRSPATVETAGDRSAKQPYRRPTMEKYGDLKEITRTVGLTGNNDGGPVSGLNKTSVLNVLG